ncbi:hypothetical protein N5P37_003240, partial [Trichoderma harzianum]
GASQQDHDPVLGQEQGGSQYTLGPRRLTQADRRLTGSARDGWDFGTASCGREPQARHQFECPCSFGLPARPDERHKHGEENGGGGEADLGSGSSGWRLTNGRDCWYFFFSWLELVSSIFS